jgi:serine protease Do
MCPRTLAFPLAVLAAVAPLAAAGERGPAEVEALQQAVERVVERAEPSVVCVLVSRSDAYRRLHMGPSDEAAGKLGRFAIRAALRDNPGPRDGKRAEQFQRYLKELDLSDPKSSPESYGSGVVIDASGLVLTNAHVVRNATKIYVRLPGGRGSWADIHAADPRSDLAVLRLLDRPAGLQAIKFGDGGKVRKGQFVIALSNPSAAGFRDASPSASWGIVSNLRHPAPGDPDKMDRAKITLHHYGTLIQYGTLMKAGTGANLGCSGGALLNLQGEMVGLTTALGAISGADAPSGFAVPLDAAMRRVIEVLRRGEEVEYGFLGVMLGQRAAAGQGVHLQGVSAGGPAQRAGIRGEDWVVAINGEPVRKKEDLFLLVGRQLAGTRVRVETMRFQSLGRPARWQRQTHEVTLAKYYVPAPSVASHRPPAPGGVRVDHLSTLCQRSAFPAWAPPPPDGVVIREVVPGSAADKAQLQVDKVITAVNGRPVKEPAEFYREMARAKGRAELTVLNSDSQPERVTIDTR